MASAKNSETSADTLEAKVDRILQAVLEKIETSLEGNVFFKDLSNMLRTLYVISKKEKEPSGGNPALPARYRKEIGSGKNIPVVPNPFGEQNTTTNEPVDVTFTDA